MKHPFNLMMGGIGLLALAGCKSQPNEQVQQPNVIYVFPDQYRNQAMGFGGRKASVSMSISATILYTRLIWTVLPANQSC